MALETAMNAATRQLGVDAVAHHFGDVVEGQLQPGPQFADQCLFIPERLIGKVLGVCERSVTVVRPRQRRIVVSLTPSSAAKSATGFLLR